MRTSEGNLNRKVYAASHSIARDSSSFPCCTAFTMFDTNVLHEAGPCSFARCGQVYYAPFDEHFLPRLEKFPFRNGRRGPPETRMACGGGLYAQGVTCAA